MISKSKATILEDQSLSQAIELNGHGLTAIEMPAAWTAAALTFQVSTDGLVFNDLYDDEDAEVSIPAAVSRVIALNKYAQHFSGLSTIKIRSGTTALPVAQAADRVITLIIQ